MHVQEDSTVAPTSKVYILAQLCKERGIILLPTLQDITNAKMCCTCSVSTQGNTVTHFVGRCPSGRRSSVHVILSEAFC